MMQRVFVKVVGFASVERHALNTAFRLSQDKNSGRTWSYEPWVEGQSPVAPRLALIDGSSPDASEALQQVEQLGGVGIIWVGSISPAKAWGCFQRPIQWATVLQTMDNYFTPRCDGLDVDLGGDTWPSVLESTGGFAMSENKSLRALIAEPDERDRHYWRSKLGSYGITQIDEVSNVLQAKERLTPGAVQPGYDIAVIDLDLPAGDPWTVVAKAAESKIQLRIVTHQRMSLSNRMTAKVNGATGLGKPIDPIRINALLGKLTSTP